MKPSLQSPSSSNFSTLYTSASSSVPISIARNSPAAKNATLNTPHLRNATRFDHQVNVERMANSGEVSSPTAGTSCLSGKENANGVMKRTPGLQKLKKTCEACVKLKVKCSGKRPCDRCSKAGRECVFLPRRPRILTKPYKKRKRRVEANGSVSKANEEKEKLGNGNGRHSSDNSMELKTQEKQDQQSNKDGVKTMYSSTSEDFIGILFRKNKPRPNLLKREPAEKRMSQQTAIVDPVSFDRYLLS